ncbi:MAG: sulfotransferase family 2 domain-containing protein [Pseudomonadota bacterium]
MAAPSPFFWLHIKKSAGISTRQLLKPHYRIVDRTRKPACFIQSPREDYNDILNNYRVVLGEYQFRRALFAKSFLYPRDWDDMVSFAFVREPVSRAVSMFFYLYWGQGFSRFKKAAKASYLTGRAHLTTAGAFDAFLDAVAEARTSDSHFEPFSLHFTTHTAPMWEDVTDLDGQVLLNHVFRMEDLTKGIAQVFQACGIDQQVPERPPRANMNTNKADFTPSTAQLRRIEAIYAKDFDLYENSILR